MCKSEKAKKIIALAELNADIPVSELAKMSGLREHSLRHFIKTLTQSQIIKSSVDINPYALGLKDYTVFFCLTDIIKGSRKAFIKELARNPKIGCIQELAGDFHHSITCYVKEVSELRAIFEDLGSKFGNTFVSKSVSTRIAHATYGKKYLTSGTSSAAIQRSYSDHSYDLDNLDLRILSALLKTPGASKNLLAKQVMIPAATLNYRIDRLKERGIVRGWIYKVNSSKLGRQVYNMLLYLKRVDPSLRRELEAFFKSHPLVTNTYECIADWDFQIYVEPVNAKELLGFRELLYEKFGSDILTVKTMTVLCRKDKDSALIDCDREEVRKAA